MISRVFLSELQVREQERSIALQVRREVQERKERELRSLATALREEWRAQRGERIQTLEKLYEETLRDVGQGQRDAQQNVRAFILVLCITAFTIRSHELPLRSGIRRRLLRARI